MIFHPSERSWTRLLRTCAVVVAVADVAAFAQSNLGSIQGTVVGSDGTPIPGAHVYAAVKATNQKTAVPPTLMSRIQAAAIAGQSAVGSASVGTKVTTPTQTSAFLISAVPAGAYILCAQTTTPGWLDPCHWSASLPTITLAAGQNLTGQVVMMAKGAVVLFTIVDVGKLLPTTISNTAMPQGARIPAIPQDVEIIAHASNSAYYNAQIASITATGQTRQLTLPFGLPHTVTVRSQQFSLLDATGMPVAAAGESQTFQIPAGAAPPQFTYTIVGKAH